MEHRNSALAVCFGMISSSDRRPGLLCMGLFSQIWSKRQNAPDPVKPEPMRLEQGLLPCQLVFRCWLPVF